jgi:hypothetical protein
MDRFMVTGGEQTSPLVRFIAVFSVGNVRGVLYLI